MTVRAINKSLLDLLLMMGKESHPREFAAFLIEENGILTELNLIPGTIGGSQSASVPFEMVPLSLGISGSAHSHPNGVIRPSEADIGFFSRSGSCHIIIGYPYEEHCWGSFHPDGTRYDLEVIP